jgi:rod shape-determining protein MreC
VHDTRRTRLVLGVLLILAIGLITFSYRDDNSAALTQARGVGSSVFGPVERLTAAGVRPVSGFFDSVFGSPSSQGQVRALQRQNQQLAAELSAARLNKADAAELNRLLQLSGKGGYRVVAANVIAVGQGYEDTITIDSGSRDGIQPDETVLNGNGLVGKVTQVGPDSATVLLAVDASSSVGARLEGSNEIGVVTGSGKTLTHGGAMRLQMLDANVPLQAGQRIVTFGSQGGRPFAPGVPIGAISQVTNSAGSLTRNALVRPYVNFTALQVVGVVVVPPRHDPRDSVLPPAPAPTPAPTPSGRKHHGVPATSPTPSAVPSGPGA